MTPVMCSPFGDVTADLLRRGACVRFRAMGHSMQPTIEDGEVITVRPVAPGAVTHGDILLYRGKSGLIAHRVVGLTRSVRREGVTCLTRGDASVDRDDPVGPEQVLGRVTAVQREGRTAHLTSRRAKWLSAGHGCAVPLCHYLAHPQVLSEIAKKRNPLAAVKRIAKGSLLGLLAGLLLLASGLATGQQAWAAYAFRKPITIDRTKVGNTGAPTTLSNYPLLYSVTDLDLRTTANGGDVISANGYDIIFTAEDATTCGGPSTCNLDHEIETWNGTTGNLIAWVRLPSVNTISAASNTVINIRYSDSTVTTSQENPAGVWDTNYKGVWHLKEDPSGGAPQMKDSTINANHGTTSGMSIFNQTNCKISTCLNFDGSNDFVNVGPVSSLDDLGPLTISAWIQIDTWGGGTCCAGTGKVAVKSNASGTSSSIWFDLDNTSPQATTYAFFREYTGVGSTDLDVNAPNGSLAANGTTWYYVVVTWTGGDTFDPNVKLYKDGNVVAYGSGNSNGSGTKLSDPAFNWCIGGRCDANVNWDGRLDEVRFSSVDRDAHWIKTEYNNMNNPGDIGAAGFYTVGGEVTAVRMKRARAISHEGVTTQVVEVQWRTSYEADHLGFHVYREQHGQLVRLTPALVAGSALLAGAGTVLTAGQSYTWWDVLPATSGPLQYWLEEVDLKGRRTWHGPVAVQAAPRLLSDEMPERVQSVLLSRLGRGKGRPTGVPGQAKRHAPRGRPTLEALAVQQQLAASPAVKLEVQHEGWYRVDQPTLVAAGLDPWVHPRHLQLFVEGKEVPLLVTGDRDGRFDPGDAIEFYGLGLDTPWTDARTYWLVAGSHAGQRISEAAPGAQSSGRLAGQGGPTSFPFTLEWRPRMLYFAALLNGEADNFFGPVVSTEPVEQDLIATQLDPAPPGEAQLEVTLQGLTDGLHQVAVRLNGLPVGSVTWSGQAQGTTAISLPQAQLHAGANRLTLVAEGGELDFSLVAVVRLTYWHRYQAEGDVLRAPVPAGELVTLGGFSSPQIRVMDVTQPEAVRAVAGRVTRQGPGYAVTVGAPGAGPLTLLAFTDVAVAAPATIRPNQPSQWHAAQNRAEVVMIAHGSLLPSLAALQAWRQAQGWSVALMDVEDLYDEFTFGTKSPWALRAWVQTARTRWAQPPRFLLLAGDASFDPRNFLEMGDADLVPTKFIDTAFLETASDDWFADADDDGVAELAVGRLAVRTAEEAATVVQKLIGYDRAAGGAKTAVLVSDRPKGFPFAAANTAVKALLPAGVSVQEIVVGQTDDAKSREALLAALNEGPWLVNYLGHGSIEVWQGELLASQDAGTLSNGLRLPFVAAMTCLNGFFHDMYTESLAEALQKAPQGGALAVWASSGLTEASSQALMNRALVQRLGEGLTLGEAIMQAKAETSDRDVRRTWILFGDPTTRLK